MANNTWKNYTQKDTALLDNDEVMLLDSTDGKNKRGLMSKFWDYVVDKMSTAVIGKLETENKTVIGALNYLYGNSLRKLDIKDDTAETIGKPVETLKNNIEKFQSSSDIVYFGFIQCGTRAQYIGFTILENQYASFLIHSYGTDLVQLKRINGKWE
jgi:hypothetical protein